MFAVQGWGMSRSDGIWRNARTHPYVDDSGPQVPPRGLSSEGRNSLWKGLARLLRGKRPAKPPSPPEIYRRG